MRAHGCVWESSSVLVVLFKLIAAPVRVRPRAAEIDDEHDGI